MEGRIAIGTSGWSYGHWAGLFYPHGLGRTKWLAFYQGVFPTVEVNYTFYQMPSSRTIEAWRRNSPPGFRFVLKGSRYVTHHRRLSDCEAPISAFCDRIRPLGGLLRAILWQLPPTLERNVGLLEQFVAALPGEIRHAVEFRHPSWLRGEVFEVLRSRQIAHVAVSSGQMPAELTATADFVYVRFHGLGGNAYSYAKEDLWPWAEWLKSTASRGAPGFAFFNNDAKACAPADARRLIKMLGEAAVSWPPRQESEGRRREQLSAGSTGR